MDKIIGFLKIVVKVLVKVLLLIGENPSGQRQNRTADPLFFRQVLYRLSYLASCGDDGIRTRDLLRDRQA